MCVAIDFDARHHVPSDAALHAAADTKRSTMCQAMVPPCVQPLHMKRGIACQAMLHCMQQLIRSDAPCAKRCCPCSCRSEAGPHMPSVAALHAETDTSEGSRHYVPGDAAPMRAAIESEARHPVLSDAALYAAIADTKQGTMCQAMLLPCVQLLIGREASHAKRCCIACSN